MCLRLWHDFRLSAIATWKFQFAQTVRHVHLKLAFKTPTSLIRPLFDNVPLFNRSPMDETQARTTWVVEIYSHLFSRPIALILRFKRPRFARTASALQL